MSMSKKWTFEEARRDYKENNKNCNNCDFVHRYLYPTCMIKEGILKIRFPKTKAKYCKYYTTTNEDI